MRNIKTSRNGTTSVDAEELMKGIAEMAEHVKAACARRDELVERVETLERGLSEIEQITLNDRATAEKQVAVRDIVRSLMER